MTLQQAMDAHDEATRAADEAWAAYEKARLRQVETRKALMDERKKEMEPNYGVCSVCRREQGSKRHEHVCE